jgi:hypothetical protein
MYNQANRDTFGLMNVAELNWLMANAPRSSFAKSLLDQIDRRGELSDKQIAVVTRIISEQDEPKAQPLDFSNIVVFFDRAIAKGAKKPVIRTSIDGNLFRFSLAPVHGKNAGCIYVKLMADHEWLYQGKIDAQGRFFPIRETSKDNIALLERANSDFSGSVSSYGHHTGSCGYCGLELKDPVSIALAYGPICADNYGLPHNETVAKMVRPELFAEEA